MTLLFDLHSHTHHSDGSLSPAELMQRAVARGVDVLAITDHDTVDAYSQLPVFDSGLRLVPGIELSTHWQSCGIHVLGLNIDLASESIQTATKKQSQARLRRAVQIGRNLQRQGFDNAYESARELAGGGYVGRPHFAQHLVNIGAVRNLQAAFKKHLGTGTAGDVKQYWADLEQVVGWIRHANGIAVLAHPLKYKLTRTKLKKLLDSFVLAGGQGMEVVSGRQQPHETSGMAKLCEERNLLASVGSDFHKPDMPWAELGAFHALPPGPTPVWENF